MWKYGRVVQCQGQLLFKFGGRNLGSVEVEGHQWISSCGWSWRTTRPTTAYHRIPSELIHSICQDTQQSLYRTLRGGVGLIHVEKSGSNFFLQNPTDFHMGMDQYLLIPFFRGINIHLPAISMFTRGTRFWHTAIYNLYNSFLQWSGHTRFFFSVLHRNVWRTPFRVASRLSKDQAGFLLETLVSTCSSTTRMGEGRRSAGLHFDKALEQPIDFGAPRKAE